jgi:hypothetical protein
MTDPTIGAVLPVKLTGRHYEHNLGLCDVMLSSFRAAGLHEVLAEILVVVPPDEVGVVERHRRHWPDMPLRVISEQELLPQLADFVRPHQLRPWHRQQILKLAAVSSSEHPFTLVCDPDILAIKPITLDLLLPGGRGLLEREARAVHETWWRDSGELLGCDPGIDLPGIGVTPELLSRDVVRTLTAHLEERHQRPWFELLLTTYTTWTEYTLYGHALEQLVDRSAYHVFPDEIGSPVTLHARRNVWDESDLSAIDFSEFFAADETGLFAIVQSALEIAPLELRDRLAPWLPITVTDYERVDRRSVHLREAYGRYARGVTRLAHRALPRRRG